MQLGLQQAKAAFFDTEAVMNAMDKAVQRSLSRVGAFVRTRMISMILRHKVGKGFGIKSKVKGRAGVSPPGTPPYTHTGVLAKFLFFAWDDSARAVVVGPVLFSGASEGQTPRAPEALEYGGPVSAKTRRGNKVMRRYRPRPFAQPALEAELDAGTIDKAFKDSLTRLVGG
jgi:hypothetical protein